MRQSALSFGFISIFLLGPTATSFAENGTLSPRARALIASQAIHGDARPFERRMEEFRAAFPERAGIGRVGPDLTATQYPVNSRDAAQGVLAGYEIYFAGQWVRLAYEKNKAVNVGGKNLYLLRGVGATFLMIDGIARGVLAYDGREATISPILTYAQVRTGLADAPNDRLPQEPEYEGLATAEQQSQRRMIFALELGVGSTAIIFSTVGGGDPTFGRRAVRRVLRVGGPVLLVDGYLRIQEAQYADASLLPILTFAQRTIASQPLYESVTVGDLTEDLLRRLGWIE